jgi:V8-like Glu-specific endopeptidase
MIKKLLVFVIAIAFILPANADEGMWLPMFIKRLNYVDMEKEGLQLTAEEIYSINNSSLKDAIVAMGGGFCTAEIISPEGLMLTNHHCGYSAIQENSTPENNILDNGFWATSKSDEIPIEGLTISILDRMEDVTEQVLNGVNIEMSEEDREKLIQENLATLKEENEVEDNQRLSIKGFFYGKEYYMFVYNEYADVRLVGTPPQSIGKYGGDTDNWMWPRHTGDFSMFRIYASPDNAAAEYAEENKPFTPDHFLPISMEGTPEGSFAMIFGFPGSTNRYMTSYEIQNELDVHQPSVVKIRTVKLDVMKEDMDENSVVKLQYAAKYAQTANYWKYYIGQQEQLKRNHVKAKKEKIENDFTDWVNSDEELKMIYSGALADVAAAEEASKKYILPRTYFFEAIYGADINKLFFKVYSVQKMLVKQQENKKEMSKEEYAEMTEKINKKAAGISAGLDDFFKNFNKPTAQKVYGALLNLYYTDVPEEFTSEELIAIGSKYKGDFNKFAADAFAKSVFPDEAKLKEFLAKPDLKTFEKDPMFLILDQSYAIYKGASDSEAKMQYDRGMRLFVDGLRLMNPEISFYPDANSTLRLTYGQVLSYDPQDAVHYSHFTTLDGLISKEDPTNPEFEVPAKLKELYESKDYGQYADVDGSLHICFLSNNDITGGNSGSPVVNGKGHLIGVAFDGNWEAMSGDIFFEKTIQRTISVDIRYVLFIIDKYAGASSLVDEMMLIYPDPVTTDATPVNAEPKAALDAGENTGI